MMTTNHLVRTEQHFVKSKIYAAVGYYFLFKNNLQKAAKL